MMRKGGNFFPLPTEWRQLKGTKAVEIYRECEANYRKYRKQVILPIFAQIASCDSCIYCVDIFNILGSGGPAAFASCSEEIKNFIHTVTQGSLSHLIRNGRRCKIHKVAYVATKSDLVYDEDLDHLQSLLSDLVIPYDEGNKLASGCFTCTAWCSTWRDDDQTMAKSDNASRPVPLKASKLPEKFPSDWKPEAFSGLMQSIFPATAGAKPPQQTGIDTILTFVTEKEQSR